MFGSFFRKTLKQATAPLVREVGSLGVVYGAMDKTALIAAAAGMDAVTVEPALYPCAPLPNAYAYVPLSGFHSDNPLHKPFLEAIEAADGFLLDPSGTRLKDPHGAGTFLIDYRKTAVRTAMRRYLTQYTESGYRGFFFDAIDSLILAEKLAPNTHGVARAAGQFLEEVSPALRATGLRLIVNGGLYSAKGIDLLPMIGASGAALAAEHQYTDGKGGLRKPADAKWTQTRLIVYLAAAAAAGHGGRFYFIESPIARDALAAHYRDGAQWATQLLTPLKRRFPLTPVEFGLYFTDNGDYTALTARPAA